MAKRAQPEPRTTTAEAAGRILAAIARVPRGHVATYGSIARDAGLPGRARLVGTALRSAPESAQVPWFRVINASGRISFPKGSKSYQEQYQRLTAEGVRFAKGRVDLKQYGWPQMESLDESLWGTKARRG